MRVLIIILIALSYAKSWSQEPMEGAAQLFQQRCTACHTVGEGDRTGPDLLNVTQHREEGWLIRWIMGPDKMLAEKDPLAMELFKKYKMVPMPNMGVTEAQAKQLIAYIVQKSSAEPQVESSVSKPASSSAPTSEWLGTTQFLAFIIFLVLSLIVTYSFWRVARSTGDPVPVIDMKAAYALRKKLFLGASLVVGGTMVATLSFTPYPVDLRIPDQLIYVAANQFSFTYSSEPIISVEDMGRIPTIGSLEIPRGALVEFRVTSLDVTHAFAIFDPHGSVLAQTQAMPGYVNRLRVKFTEPGHYNVLCFEYCGVAHHLMRTAFVVK